MRYVTYDDAGDLTGCFLQDPPEAHIGHLIEVDETLVPVWQAYRASDARDGVELAPPPAPQAPAVPQTVSRRQARQALLLGGLLGKVQPAIDAIADATQRGLAQIEWDDSQVYERQRPILISLAAAMGLDGDGLDQLFITAGGL